MSVRIRVTLAELEKIKDVSGIAVRFATGYSHLSVFRFDDDMIVTPLLTHRVGHDASMPHLRRHQDDGMFDRFTFYTEQMWTDARPVWDSTGGDHGKA